MFNVNINRIFKDFPPAAKPVLPETWSILLTFIISDIKNTVNEIIQENVIYRNNCTCYTS